jgi:hypothetical protein
MQPSLLRQQFRAEGLQAVADEVIADGDLELEDALALSRASLPILGKIVELWLTTRAASAAAVPGALPIQRTASLPESPRRVGQRLADWVSYCQTLIAYRDEFSPAAHAIAWYPVMSKTFLADQRDGDFTGVDVLRAIALARLLLPPEVEIQAPLATLGPKLAQVALNFGASHLGYVAPQDQPSHDPLIASFSVFDELAQSCLPTSIKEESTAS